MQLKSLGILIASTLAFSNISFGDVCLYGLSASSAAECPNIQKQALERVRSAKTICFSANSQVKWDKNNKQPVGALTTMRAGARIAMKGFTPLNSCELADLVVKIDYDAVPELVTLAVRDAESGDTVFRESRTVSDLSSDVTRMATHFQKMRSDALAGEADKDAEIEAKAKRKAFFAHLPRHWRYARKCDEGSPCPEGTAVDVWLSDDVLYEASTQTLADSMKLETTCAVKPGADEFTPWAGYCTHSFSWPPPVGKPTCTVQTQETITTISAREIAGRSQTVDSAPLHRNPPSCPVAVTESRDFSLAPEKDHDSE